MRYRTLWIALPFAAVLTALLYLGLRIPGNHWWERLLWPGLAAGVAASGNAHQPNVAVTWLSELIALWLLLALALIVAFRIRNSNR